MILQSVYGGEIYPHPILFFEEAFHLHEEKIHIIIRAQYSLRLGTSLHDSKIGVHCSLSMDKIMRLFFSEDTILEGMWNRYSAHIASD
jgi:hypothetical protein